MIDRSHNQLQKEQKKSRIIKLYDENLYTRTDEAVESLTRALENFILKESKVKSFILYECNLSIKKPLVNP